MEQGKQNVEFSLRLMTTNDAPGKNTTPRSSNPKPETYLAPDGGWGWIVCFACFVVHVMIDGLMYSSGILFVEFLEYFNRSKAETSWIVALPFLTSEFISPLISALSNRFGCRIVCITGSVLFSMGLIISAFVTNMYILYLSLGVFTGFGYCMMYTTSVVSVSRYFDKRRALATGLGVCGAGIGTFIFGPITKFLIDRYTWRGAIWIESALMLNCIACGMVYRPLEEKKLPKAIDNDEDGSDIGLLAMSIRTSVSEDEKQYIVDTNKQQQSGTDVVDTAKYIVEKRNTNCSGLNGNDNILPLVLDSSPLKIGQTDIEPVQPSKRKKRSIKYFITSLLDFRLFRNKGFCIIMVNVFLSSISSNIPYIYLPDRAKDIGITGYQGAWLISTMGITNTIGRVMFGFISDKKNVNRLYIYICSILLCGISTSSVPLFTSFEMLVVYSAVYGVSSGVTVSLLTVIITDIVGIDKLLDTFGFGGCFAGLAQLIGPPGAGALYDVTGSYSVTFIIYGIILAASGAILFVIPYMKKDTTDNVKGLNDIKSNKL